MLIEFAVHASFRWAEEIALDASYQLHPHLDLDSRQKVVEKMILQVTCWNSFKEIREARLNKVAWVALLERTFR